MHADSTLEILASALSYADSVKESARLRSQCTLEEWEKVKGLAKEIYKERYKKRVRSFRA